MKETEIKDMGKMAKGIEKQLKQSEKTRADLSHKVASGLLVLTYSCDGLLNEGPNLLCRPKYGQH